MIDRKLGWSDEASGTSGSDNHFYKAISRTGGLDACSSVPALQLLYVYE